MAITIVQGKVYLLQISCVLGVLTILTAVCCVPDPTCQFSLMQNCTRNYWLGLKRIKTEDVHDKIQEGCAVAQNYTDCLVSNVCENDPTVTLQPKAASIDSNGTVSFTTNHGQQGYADEDITLFIAITDRDFVILQTEPTTNVSIAANVSSDEVPSNLTDEVTNEVVGVYKEWMILDSWRYAIFETMCFYRKIGLCPDLDTALLKEASQGIIDFRTGKTVYVKEDFRCFKSFQCFIDLIDRAVGDWDACDGFLKTVDCLKKLRDEECQDIPAIYDYVWVMKTIYSTILNDMKSIPGYCSYISDHHEKKEEKDDQTIVSKGHES